MTQPIRGHIFIIIICEDGVYGSVREGVP